MFKGGGKKYPCEQEVEEATSLMLNRIAGGALSWDSITLTGGGNPLLFKRLIPVLNHENVILADDAECLHLANVRGGMKLWRLYEALQVL